MDWMDGCNVDLDILRACVCCNVSLCVMSCFPCFHPHLLFAFLPLTVPRGALVSCSLVGCLALSYNAIFIIQLCLFPGGGFWGFVFLNSSFALIPFQLICVVQSVGHAWMDG